MDIKTQRMIQNHLRRTWSYCDAKKEVKKSARVELEKGKFKNGKVIMRVFYKCASCQENHKSDEVQIDHIECVGPFKGSWDDYMSRLFCSKENLACICKKCHKEKTKNEWHKSRGIKA